MKKIILGIETSCDETGVALVEASGGLKSPKFKVLKNLVASQIKIHEPFGGVVPNLAKREHQKNLPVLLDRITNYESGIRNGSKSKIHNSKFNIQDVDLIAVTVGPGLEPALWTGITFAQELAKRYKKPLVGTNHLEGHLYSFLLPKKTVNSKLQKTKSKNLEVGNWKLIFPAISLLVSGGHTILLLVKDLKTWKHLGETRDDAVGEAFDKVARLLKLPYPGGPALEKLAKKGKGSAIEFPRPMMHEKSYDFSFSGLKTSVLYHLRDLGYSHWPIANSKENKKLKHIPEAIAADVAASFQAAAVDVLVKKTLKAVNEFGANSIILSGGVAANSFLRKNLKKEAGKFGVRLLVAEQKYNTDNGVMIAAAGYMTYLRKKKYPMKANGNLRI
ncbi:MAG: tRNA (adenosine(37)-N6)-threonylcarbamoyltransferase complex transferase subunit TsaD [Patescibacteria group bacterium]